MTRTWWAAAALLAIFVMHGLATHGLSAAPNVSEPAPVATAGVDHDAHTGHDGHADAAGRAFGSSLAAGTHESERHEMSVLGLCLAVLATAAVALLRLRRPESGLIDVLPRAVSTAARAVGVRADHAPPDLHALSILRC